MNTAQKLDLSDDLSTASMLTGHDSAMMSSIANTMMSSIAVAAMSSIAADASDKFAGGSTALMSSIANV